MRRMTGDRAAYAVGQFRDAEAEVARLRAQAAIVAAAEEEAFEALGLPRAGRALELGCGPGFVAARFMATRPELRVLGVDRDPRVLSEARGVPVVRGDAAALPVADGCVDFAYARLVLRHLVDPAAAVAELRRVTRPGGRVVLCDTDDDALVLWPPPDGFGPALRARQQTFARRGADPFIGRRLAPLLEAAGFADVGVRPLVVHSVEVGRPAFAAIVLAPITDAIDEDLMPSTEVERAAAGLRAWGEAPEGFGMTTAVLAGGTVPG